jgi:hypothetical protein
MGIGAARNLAELAGGADRIADFCATTPSAQPSAPGHNKSTPSRAAPIKTGNGTPAGVARRTRTRSGKAS